MHHRRLASLTVFGVVLAGLTSPTPAAGQATAPSRTSARPVAAMTPWTPPRTPEGQPDLQGIWVNNSATPLERPQALQGRQSLTDAEVAMLEERAAQLLADSNNDFPAGDNLFLAALAGVAQYKNPNSTDNALAMDAKEFDNRTSLIVDPPEGRVPWTREGKQRFDAANANRLALAPEGPEALPIEVRCITYGVPRLGLANFNSAGTLGYYQIVQAKGYVILLYEAIHEARIIPLDGRPHLPESVRSWIGDSRGRWEGETLVVETTNFLQQSSVMGSNGETFRLVERFTRIAAGEIRYEMTLSDPATWTRPWTVMIRLRASRTPIYEYACHEGNAAIMEDIFTAARALDKAGKDADGRPK